MRNDLVLKVGLTSIFFFAIFGITLPLFIVLSAKVFTLSILLLLLLAAFESYKLMKLMLSGRKRLLELTFHSFVYIFLVIAPLVQICNGSFPLGGGTLYAEADTVKAVMILVLGLATYELGLLKRKNTKQINRYKEDSSLNLPLINLISIAFMAFAVSRFGGVSNLGGDRSHMDATVALMLNSLLRTPIYVAWILNLIRYKSLREEKKRVTFLFKGTLAVLFVLNIIASNPFYTSRYWFGAIFISSFLIFIKWKRTSSSLIILATLFGFLVIFPYADVSRSDGEFFLGIDAMLSNLKVGDFDAFQQLINTHKYVGIYGLSLGRQLLGSLLFFVPRSIWPMKPVGTGYTIGTLLGYVNTNISAPLWAEFYINFGIIGVALMFYLYGRVTKNLQDGYNQTSGQLNLYQIFVPFYSFYQFFLLRGDLLSSFANLVPVIVFIQLYLSITKKQKEKSGTNKLSELTVAEP